MEYQISMDSDRDYRLGRYDQFSYDPQKWVTFKTRNGALKALERMDNLSVYGLELIEYMDEIDVKAHNLEVYQDGINSIRSYLNSDKYGKDIMVNKNDILMRIREMMDKMETY